MGDIVHTIGLFWSQQVCLVSWDVGADNAMAMRVWSRMMQLNGPGYLSLLAGGFPMGIAVVG